MSSVSSTMSVTQLQKAIKESVLPVLMDTGLSSVELIQSDSYKWILVTEVEGEQRFAEVALTAKKADFTYEDACIAGAKYAEKAEKAVEREASRAKARAEKAAAKAESAD